MDLNCLNIAHKSSCFDEEWLMLLRDALSALKVALEKINYLKQYITKKLNSEKSSMVCEVKKESVEGSTENYFSPAALAQLYQAECERLARLEQSSRKSLNSTRQKQKENIINNSPNSSSTNEPHSERRKRKKNPPVKCLKKEKSNSDKDLSCSNNMAIDSCLDDSVNNSTVDDVLNSQAQQDNLTPKSNLSSKEIPQEQSNLNNLKGADLGEDDVTPSIRTVCKDHENNSDPSFSDFSYTENQTSMMFDSALKEAQYKVTFKIKNNSISDFEIKEALERKGFSNFVVFVRNKQTRTRGIITFKDEETMNAVETCSDLIIHGQPLKIRPCNETLVTNDSKSNSSSTPGKVPLKVKHFQEPSEVVLDQDCHLNNIPFEPTPQSYEDNGGTSVASNIVNNNFFIKKEIGCHLTESLTTNETVKSLTLLSTHIEDAITVMTEDGNQKQLLQKLSPKKPRKNRERHIKSIKEDPSISPTPQLKNSPTLDHNADITPDVKPILKSSSLEENGVEFSENDISSEILSLNVKNSTDVSVGIFPDSRDFVLKEITPDQQLLQKLSPKKPRKNRERHIKSIKEDPSISPTPQLKNSPTLDHNADNTQDVKPILKSSLLEENGVEFSENDISSEILSLNVKNSTDVSVGIFPDSRDFVLKEITPDQQLLQKLSPKKPRKNRERHIKSIKEDPSISPTPQLKNSPTLDHNADNTQDVKPILKSSLLEENGVEFSENDISSEILSLNVKNSTDVSVGIFPDSRDFVLKEITPDQQLLQKLSPKKPRKNRERHIKSIKEDPSISPTPQLKNSPTLDHNADNTQDVKPILKSSLLEENGVEFSENDISSEILSLNVKNSTDVSVGIFPDSRDFVLKEISTGSKQACSINVNQGYNDNNISKDNNPVKEIDESLLINVSCGYPSMRKSFSPGRVRRNSLKSPVPSNYTHESDRESNAASLGGKSLEALSVHSESNFGVMTQENDCDAFDRYSESNLNFSSKKDVVQEDDQAYTKCFNFVNQCDDIINIIQPFIEPCSAALDGSITEPYKNKCHEYHIVKKDTLDPKQDYQSMKTSCNVVSGCISADGDIYSSADNKEAYSSVNYTGFYNSANNTDTHSSTNNTDTFNSAYNTATYSNANNTDAFNSANNTDAFNSANNTDAFNSANNTDAFNSANNTDAFNSANNTYSTSDYDFNFDYLNNKPYSSGNISSKPGDHANNKPYSSKPGDHANNKPYSSSNSPSKPGYHANNKPYSNSNSLSKPGDHANNKPYSSSNFSRKSTHYPRSKYYSNQRYTPYKRKQDNYNLRPSRYWHNHFNRGNNSSNYHNQSGQFSKSSRGGTTSNMGSNRRNSFQNSRNMNHQQRTNNSRK